MTHLYSILISVFIQLQKSVKIVINDLGHFNCEMLSEQNLKVYFNYLLIFLKHINDSLNVYKFKI